MPRVFAGIYAQLALLPLLLPGAQAAADAPAPHLSMSPELSQATAGYDPQRAPQPGVLDPAGSGASPVVADRPASTGRQRLVYACHDAAVPVFSDRPCGASAHAWRLDLPPPQAAGAAPNTRKATPVAATRPIRSPAPPREQAAAPDPCVRLADELASIDARMRQGYSAREAARLWQRWRDAKAKLRTARC